MTETMTSTVTLVRVQCWCGMPFAIPEALDRSTRQNPKQEFHCPLGHGMVRSESEADKLKRELAQERARRDQSEARVNELRAERDRERTTRRRYQTRARNLEVKAKSGECPCCERKFADLITHMAEQHPDFQPEEAAAEE